MKKVIYILTMGLFIGLLTGCGSSGKSTNSAGVTPPATDTPTPATPPPSDTPTPPPSDTPTPTPETGTKTSGTYLPY
jgi:hypothetical protein